MKISLIDIDSKIPNLALKKIEKYHLNKGDKVMWNNELIANISDKVYVSCIFDWNKKKAQQWEGKAEIGGSGYDLYKKLPPEIEAIRPRINLGFTTRGCIRNCPFCIVPRKEGNIKEVGDIYDIWDGQSKKITLLDNNILGMPNHFFKIASQLKKEQLKVDFNQGLDCRLLTDEIAKCLSELSHVEYRFAFDWDGMDKIIEHTIQLLKKYGINRCNWYVLVGFNTTFEQDLHRLNFLRLRKQNAYVQRYTRDRKYIPLARWVNQHNMFYSKTYEEFLELCKTKIGGKYITEFNKIPQ